MNALSQQEIKEMMPIINMCVNQLKKDGVTYEMVMAMDTADQLDLVRAYVAHAFKKIQQMQTMYLTNPEFKQTMQDLIYAMLTQK